MTTTFDPTLADQISQVRQEIGDVGNGAGSFAAPFTAEYQDATITAYLTSGLTVVGAAARLAWGLAAKWAKMVDVDVDRQLTRASQRYRQYVELAKRLDERLATDGANPTYAPTYGGVMVTGVGDCRGPMEDCPLDRYVCPTDCC